MHDTLPFLEPSEFPAIRRGHVETLQINIGLKCNQACLHCHTNSNPYRREKMSDETIDLVLEFLADPAISSLDITGGAPELHPRFRVLVEAARPQVERIIDRCNLTILEQPGQEDLAEFLAENQVHVIASLPCYTEDNVDGQRGEGTYAASIRALEKLNSLGYGESSSGLRLSLVYNPLGPYLPAPQAELEKDFREHLEGEFGIRFNELLVITNMPIKRFGSTLLSRHQFDDYLDLLKNAYQASNLDKLMCRSMISLDWQGYVYDCDFNQMLGLNLVSSGRKIHIRDLLETSLSDTAIQVRNHCFGCTAGQGSSCGGALSP